MSVRVQVYVDNGNVYHYDVTDEAKGREHADAIIRTGYRSVCEGERRSLTWWPPHRIVKVKLLLSEDSSTSYTDTVSAT